MACAIIIVNDDPVMHVPYVCVVFPSTTPRTPAPSVAYDFVNRIQTGQEPDNNSKERRRSLPTSHTHCMQISAINAARLDELIVFAIPL